MNDREKKECAIVVTFCPHEVCGTFKFICTLKKSPVILLSESSIKCFFLNKNFPL
jgi:hypothetical protein